MIVSNHCLCLYKTFKMEDKSENRENFHFFNVEIGQLFSHLEFHSLYLPF